MPADQAKVTGNGSSLLLRAGKQLAGALATSPLAHAYEPLGSRLVNLQVKRMQRAAIGERDYYGLLSLYAELQRVLFIHVPKCGGTSIRKALVDENHCAPIPLPRGGTPLQSVEYMLGAESSSTAAQQFLESSAIKDKKEEPREQFLRTFAAYQVACNPQRLFIMGHQRAADLHAHYRPGTDLFLTTVRAPAEILRSNVAYRVSHTVQNDKRPDSVELLKLLGMDAGMFTEWARNKPRELTGLILEKNSPSMARFLSFTAGSNIDSVWSGLQQHQVYIAHMSEQAQMLGRLFGEQSRTHRRNTSDNRRGLAAEFTANIQDDWTMPYVDADSNALYARLQASGIIGFWENGGSREQYHELLRKG